MAHLEQQETGSFTAPWRDVARAPLSSVAVVSRSGDGVALERAGLLPLAQGVQVWLLSCEEDRAMGRSAPSGEQAPRELPRGARVERSVISRKGATADRILEHEGARDAELIVLGPERDSLGARLFGSTAERLAEEGGRAVLLARRRPVLPYRRAIVATDFSDVSAAALDFALRLVTPERCELTALHVYDTSYLLVLRQGSAAPERLVARAEEELRGAQEAMGRFLSRWRPAVPLRPLLVSGDPAREIRVVAEAEGADLVVLGQHALDGPGHTLLGSVAAAAVRKLRCDVLIVPPRSARA